MNTTNRIRQGITITEALASIAVAAVGLFAVLAVIPFAARQTEAGLDLDVSVAVGKNAFHEFDVRGMGNIDNWRLPNIDGTPNLDPSDNFWGGKAFVIDPLFLTRNDPIANPAITVFPFPLYNNDELPAQRISPPDPRALSVNQCFYGIDRLNLSAGDRPFNRAQAETIFQSVNELLFKEPADKLQLPELQYKLLDPTVADVPRVPANWVKQKSAGNVSWMAMVVPETSDPANASPHMYRLYVIVFRGRQLNYRSSGASGEAVYTGEILGQGEGGGIVDLTLVSNASLPVPNDPRTNNSLIQDDYLNAGDWVLLTDYNQAVDPSNSEINAHGSNWRWYQVQRVDPPSPTEQADLVLAGSSIRTTLVGPDWTGRDIDLSNNNPNPTQDVRAIVLSNVVAVYEKTIRIEYDSIWNE